MNHDELLAKVDKMNNYDEFDPSYRERWEKNARKKHKALRAVVELHKPFEWNDALLGKIMVCDECCKKNTYAVTKKCQMEHEHGEGMPWCPNTIPAIERNLND